jgi:tetratricopeptide (TPR) repeat protein
VFAKSLPQVERELASYVLRDVLPSVRFPVTVRPGQARLDPKPVTALEAALLRWELLVATANYTRSDEVLADLEGRYPAEPAVQHALGDAAQRRRDDRQAATHYSRAIGLGSRSGQLRCDYAVVRRALGTGDDEVIPDLREAVALEPRLYDAQFLLGYLLLRTGNRKEAAGPLRAAVKLRPWSQTAKAQLALAESEPVQPPPPPSRPADRHLELPVVSGLLTQVDCLGEKARLHILADGRKTFVLVRDRAGVTLHGAGSAWTEFSCGPVPHQPVSVAYRVHPDTSYGTAGDAASITFGSPAR